MKSHNVVVVGTDGSPESYNAVGWAAHEAVRRGATLRIVHVWHAPAYPTDPILVTPNVEQDATTAALAVAVAAEPLIDYEVRTPNGPSALTLLGECADAALVVLGGHHRNLLDRMAFGSVTTHVLSNAPCPVVIVRESLTEHRDAVAGVVVVGIDHGDSSYGALAFAFDYAATHALELVAVQAWSARELVDTEGRVTAIDAAQLDLSDSLRPLHDAYPQVGVVTVAICDTPVNALLDWADKAELIVVGSRGRGYFTGMLLGSVSAAVAHQSPSSVAVIRSQTDT